MFEAKTNIIGCWEVDVCGLCKEEVLNPTTIKTATKFLVVEEKHKWGVYPGAEQHDFYTVLHFGKRLKVLANQLEPAIGYTLNSAPLLDRVLSGFQVVQHGDKIAQAAAQPVELPR